MSNCLLAAVTKAIEEEPTEQLVSNLVNGRIPQGIENHDSIISSYKELIREQVRAKKVLLKTVNLETLFVFLQIKV